MTKAIRQYGFIVLITALWVAGFFGIPALIGENGFVGNWFATHTVLKFALAFIALSHVTIVAMSLSFHRAHTHQAVKFHPVIDGIMQTWLWMLTSMSKLDWVSVHVYHHTHSDTERDPHSPAQKGLWHVFFLGVFDYGQAKSWPEVQKIRSRIPSNAYERYISRHLFQGPIFMTVSLMLALGPVYGSLLAFLNFMITPFFAVGGVNALAHSIGYRNYESKDESRNLGFLFFLNWIISGELDHNNHHKWPKSPSFAHRWFEFDIGWVYIRMLRQVGLATVTGHIPDYHAVTQKASAPKSTHSLPTAQNAARSKANVAFVS
jgi:stearoyl-CoA desaturase (delta-9 desaturase)